MNQTWITAKNICFGLTLLSLGVSCGTTPKAIGDFCAEQYQNVTLGGVPIGELLVAKCIDQMSVCTPEELGNESYNRSTKGYLPPCYTLEPNGACERACTAYNFEIQNWSEPRGLPCDQT